jgi:TolB protein
MKKAAAATVLATLGVALAAQADRSDEPTDAVPAARGDDRLAVARLGIVLVDRDGGNANVLTKGRGWRDYEPAWSPDGRRIAFTRNADCYCAGRIFVMRANGRGIRRLTDGRFDESPEWSPDGRLIAYSSQRGLKVMRPDGSHERRVARFGDVGEVDWSPDGRRLAFARDRFVWTARWNDGGGERRLVRGGDPDWSPDGKTLAYMPRDGGVATIGADGKGRRYLHDGLLPAWSPDGKRIAFNTWPRNKEFDLWMMTADGKHARRVSRTGSYPAWRPLPR